ncbi:MAG: 4Fe-4S binding protein [Acetobacterium woodii]|nr:4Fe-4S binding protein [Acetobacterium woodii]
MIFYFSATGNCQHVATRIATATNDEIFSMTDGLKNDLPRFQIKPDEAIGIVAPTYFIGLPTLVRDFLASLELITEQKPYTYFVATHGTTCGNTGAMVNDVMAAKGFPLDARYSIKMPDTWTPIFDLTDQAKMKKINDKADLLIDAVIDQIKHKAHGDMMKHKTPGFLARRYYRSYDKQRTTNHFHVEDSCVGCGLCAKQCPVDAIAMQNGKPVWIKEQCVMCLGCLHRCPKFSIQYGQNTKKHGQYRHPNIQES